MNSPLPRLRVAVLNRTFSPTGGGAERYSIALVEQLASRHEIHVFAQEIDHHWPGVFYHRVSAPLLKPRWVNQLWFATATWWATRRGYDVVHSHENTWHGDVQTVHVLPVRYNLFKGRTGWRRVLRWIKVGASPRLLTYLGLERARYAERPGRKIVVTSESLRAIMQSGYPASSPMISVITPGITMPRQPESMSRKHQARALLGLPSDRYCLLFVGNDYKKKGLQAVLGALALLSADAVLAVVGNPAHIPTFRALAASLKLDSRVFFLGSLPDVAPAYEAADCLVHATLEDTFAMVALEAMSHGLPVVVSGSAYCGIADLLTDGANAMVLRDPRNVEALAKTLEQLIGSPALQETLKAGAVAFASHYEWKSLAEQQEALYVSVHETLGRRRTDGTDL
ncbi:MAG: glycosyl transferase family 1 [Polaromonas sp. 39-63-203]|jgi:UDP-glucose:(heptosyl)LPS alpha-1,3-glucosyltransferase|uniref:glycosyltransferase family 4 protein n=1 Tax=Polaromonas sp. TaxID=1869339 RepID=UPI000BDC657D|nr:glycosyltransferase family 4 protein [Polaromonas sp.]OYY53482.1 MAG: glycosyl transferase family 1 [Polaromonas sp. 35-63-240]OYZ01263.1 MAG: glycosyl transferase family 1 [Polaromonas sp. 28-63-22]OYZ84633.1 MAG: glycosyl transferase family 1 [Polaromonas sp. 24-62-144]OZB00971.1 MAG: glycosyl transferase family 1 [Polaromonas sp. 39-63-203]HQS30914.1 glycosyltransferase family 4 protein [Polaromonas sp.]